MRTLIQAVHGERIRGEDSARFQGVSIDSRALRPGQLFICIAGDRFDGHDFLPEVLRRKAAGVVLSNPARLPQDVLRQSGAFAVRVPDTLRALQDLAAYHRRQYPVRVVGVTGTNGKSTTKEMIASLASTQYETLKTRGNFNNHIGLPLCLLDLEPAHRVAVMEMGMSGRGEIRRLAEIARPEIGVITNISEAHMVRLKTLKDVQAAKGELFEALAEKDTAIVNADDPLVLELARNLRCQVISFGIRNAADVQARDIRPSDHQGFDFTLSLLDREISIHLPFLGYCNVYNALAAVAAGHALGIQPENISPGLQSVQLMSQRSEVLQHNGMTLVNDTYNANPQSMLAALDTLERLPASGKKYFIAGDMLELGEQEGAAHHRLGEEVAARGIDVLVTVGNLAGLIAEGARDAGMETGRIASFHTHEEAVAFLKQNARPGDCLLFKGSRGAKIETVVQGLTT